MEHETALVATVAAGLGLAFVFGFLAARLRLPPLVGYLLAGVAVGPFTPGFVADTGLASQLAEIGVILLMFGAGLHFSLKDLMAVRRIALPGAAAQIAVASALGAAVTRLWGWSWSSGLVFGLCLSVASTVVLLRALEERGLLDTGDGRIAVGWLIVEDLAMVLALVLLPAIAQPTPDAPAAGGSLLAAIALTLGKVAAFVAVMHLLGRRAIPWLLTRVARIGSRELFTLGVLAVALGIAVGAASLFGVSFALGAFFAGVVISESDLSHKAAADALPLQDAFAVLFFVSVGMLFDLAVLIERPLQVLSVILIILVGKSLAAFAIVLAFGHSVHTALTISGSLAQIGEFSFILAALGVSLGLFPGEGQSLVLAGALLSITLNPFVFNGVKPIAAWIRARPRLLAALERPEVEPPAEPATPTLRDHAVIVGYGRVGGTIGAALSRAGIPFVVVEQDRSTVNTLRRQGTPALYGDAARPGILEHAHLPAARLLVIGAPDPYQAREVIEIARRLNPAIEIVVRTHSAAEQAHLESLGVGAFIGPSRAGRSGKGEGKILIASPPPIRLTFFVTGCLFALVFLAAGARADEVWIADGLEGYSVTALAASPADAHRLYAGTADGGVFRSLDDGRNWAPAAAGLPAGPIRALAAHPADPSVLYAGTQAGVFRTDDGGSSWTPTATGMTPAAVLELAIDPAAPDTVWAHTDEPGLLHVYKTTDGGGSWQSFTIRGPGFGTPTFGSIVGLLAHPQNRTVYAAWHEIVFYNSDGGDVWSRYSDVDHELLALLLDPFDPSVTYVGTFDAGCGRSSAFGPWSFAAGLDGLGIAELAADPLLPGVLYAAAADGRVFRSADRGGTFTELARLPEAPAVLLVCPGDGRLRAATTLGILRLGSPSEIERLPVEPARPKRRPIGIDPRN